ncbi:MAG: M20/M25/M40 family metallo-hydrolase [Rhodothermales bacterium]
MNPVDLLRALVAFPSLSHEEAEVADFVEAEAKRTGLQVGRRDNNVYAWLGDGDDLLLLNSHLDVVPPSSDHPYPPFEPTLVDGQLYGRGTVDAKASGATMLTALFQLKAEGWTPPTSGKVMVALTACEETGRGYNGLEDLRPHLPPIQAALVGEPTDMQPCLAQKGLLILRVEANGQTAHAARAHLGDNAILKAARDLQRIAEFSLDRADAFLGQPTVTPTVIEGGKARNVVPDRCTFYLDIRSTPAYTHDELIALFDEALESEVYVHSKRIIPVSTDAESRIAQACMSAIPGAQSFGSPTASDWMFLADVPTVKIGPGFSERSHTPHEHIAVSDVERAVPLYKGIIQAYFGSTKR